MLDSCLDARIALDLFIHRKAPTQDSCAHCQRSFNPRAFHPPPATFRRQRAAHHTTNFLTVNTPNRSFFTPTCPECNHIPPNLAPALQGARMLTADTVLRKRRRRGFHALSRLRHLPRQVAAHRMFASQAASIRNQHCELVYGWRAFKRNKDLHDLLLALAGLRVEKSSQALRVGLPMAKWGRSRAKSVEGPSQDRSEECRTDQTSIISKSDLVTPQSGQVQVSGTSSQRVPGAMLSSGHPSASL